MNRLNEDKALIKYQEMKSIIESEGYKLLSKHWVGFRGYYDVECPKNHSYSVQWPNFKRGARCIKCHHENMSNVNPVFKGKSRSAHRDEMDIRFKTDLINEGYAFDGSVEKYKNNITKMNVICPNNHDWEVSWNSWSSGKRCKKCFEDRVRKDTEEIRRELDLEGCQLVGEYRGALKTFNYICSCGFPSKTRIKDFRNGTRCSRCRGDRNREKLRELRIRKLQEWEEQNLNSSKNEKNSPSRE